ncbi:hypothetical protein FOC1_g10006804 [Fusarium oxysporum f. sp. cubense race 1]|uniref:Uncharacterized protein n=1 Tax=Fusarium oxysporum f. sp. cubense (strain race 1) TaxID=1229664 RepID=N4U9C8_FUSC1|nr:hypothetical protein FOC1_g10006804 [Fusarium oxysporum f. sp. cubense race 1]
MGATFQPLLDTSSESRTMAKLFYRVNCRAAAWTTKKKKKKKKKKTQHHNQTNQHVSRSRNIQSPNINTRDIAFDQK